METNRYRRVVWLSALYDLLLTLPFMTPWTARLAIGHLGTLHAALGMGGAAPPAFGPLHLLFVSFFGSVVILWSVVRLRDPRPELGLFDGLGRVAFAAWMTFALAHGETHLVVGFLVPELLWGVVQLAGFRAVRGAPSRGAAQLA
jgi:hypothetical protein